MAYIYDLSDTWDSAGTTFYGIKLNVTNSASASTSKLMSLQIGGTEKASVNKDGLGYFAAGIKFSDGTTQTTASSGPANTDSLAEGSTNLYFTNARAQSAISASGSLSYNSSTGVISYTAPTLATIATSGAISDTTGTLAVNRGGTGQTSYTDGQLLIGNSTGNTLSKATLTAGSGISITNGNGSITIAATSGGGGTVTSVAATVPTGFSISGSPITTSGTLAISFASGYSLPTTASQTNWDSVYSAWGGKTAPSGTVVGTTDTQNLTNKTLTTGNTLDAGTAVSDTGTIASSSPGFRGLPQNSQTSSYTLALADQGKHISITTGGIVIPANSSVAFPIGAAISIYNNSGSNQTISITSDTLRQAGTASTGSRTLAQYGLATLVKVSSTTWVITGAGIS